MNEKITRLAEEEIARILSEEIVRAAL